MPQKNIAQHIGTMGGDSGSLNTQYDNTLRGVPDVRFSDTSLPVFADQFQVVGTWNLPITGLSFGSLNQSWAYFAAGQTVLTTSRVTPANASLELSLNQALPNTNFYISITFPPNTHGRLRVEIKRNSVISALDNRTLGPPALRAFEIEFDTRDSISVADVNKSPATLKLSSPTAKTWRHNFYNQRFAWSKPVGDFEDADVEITTIGGSISLSALTIDPNNNKIYALGIGLTGSGTITVRVNANAATTGLTDDNDSPPAEVVETWNFDAMPSTTAFAISGVDILHSEEYNITDDHPELNGDSGMFLGVSDIKVFNNRVYFVSQVQRKRDVANELSTLKESGGALVSVSTGGGSKSVHKSYQFFRQAARSLVIHKNELYFFEGSAYLYPEAIILETGVPIPLDKVGIIHKIDTSGIIDQAGRNWRSGFPTGVTDKYTDAHGGTMCPMISHKEVLHIISQKTDIYDVNGEQWIVYGNKLNQRISLLETNGKTGFEIIESLAGLTNCIIGYEKGRFIFKPRKPTHAYLSNSLNNTQDSLSFKLPNRLHTWTASGIIRIDNEVMTYDSIDFTANTISDIVRGAYDTEIDMHATDSPIVLIDKVIKADDMSRPVNDMDIETDGTLIYNSLITTYAENQVPRVDNLSFPTVDSASINEHGEHKFKLELPLDFHQQIWATYMTRDFVNRHKNLGIKTRLILKRDFDIELGDIIYLSEPILEDIKLLCQVMSVSQHKKSEETEVIVISITPDTI